jgi:uncharacterized protein YbjT (DUF2867 family)
MFRHSTRPSRIECRRRIIMYVITGATGHTGIVAAQSLLSRGQQVRVVGRSADRLKALASAGAEPFTCDLTDTARLTEALKGADGTYVLIPPNLGSDNYRAFQDQISDSIATAVAATQVKHVVSLSSIGADKTDQTGPVVGLYHLEQKLNRIEGANVLHLRAGYFMENTLGQAGAIHIFGKTMGPLRPDLKLPMIASRDLGAVAAEALLARDFSGKQTRELQGQRDIDMTEATRVIGKAIARADLAYTQAPDEQFRAALMQMGMSSNMASLIVEMAHALNSGHMRALEPRSPQTTTPTSYQTFVNEEFLPVFKQSAAA